jgi:ankyrin repeat protein
MVNQKQLYTEAILRVIDMPLEEKNHQIFIRMFTEDPNDYEFYAFFYHQDTFQVNRAIDVDGNTALHWAITLASLSKAKWLIEHGADKKALNAKKESILCKALHSNSLYSNQSFDVVLDLMHDVLFLWDHHRRTFVHQIMLALKEGEAPFYYLNRLLHWLKQHYNGYFIQMFINAQDDHGNTPLHLAYAQCHSEAIRLLLDAGSDANIKNLQGKYPIDLNTHF